MRHKANLILFVMLSTVNIYGGTFSMIQSDSLFAAGTQPQLISGNFSFTEGPAIDASGNVYFTDQPNDRIWKYDTDGKLTLFMEKTKRSNGMYFDRKGNLISCADEENQLVSISPDKKITVLVNDIGNEKLNGPNDVWVHPNGDLYFTDPLYNRPWWKEGIKHVEQQNVYLLKAGTENPVVVDDNIEKPNGIVGTPDGRTLYVADIQGNKTYKYGIAADGKLTNRVLFADQGSDGMTIDNKGNVYLTGQGVTVYDPAGSRIAQIDVPENWTANVCFAGKKRDKLFITASKSVYIMDMRVKGVQ